MPLAGAAVGLVGAGLSAFGKSDPQFNYKRGLGDQLSEDAMRGYQNAMGNEVKQGSNAQGEFADMLRQYSQGGMNPNSQDISRANDYTNSQFQAQQTSMNQAFQDQLVSANRQAAISGRGVNDPVLRAKLAAEQTRQQQSLDSQKTGFAAQFAQQQPGQRLALEGQRADTLVQRGQMALGNQQNMFNMGQQDRNFNFNMAQADYQQQKDSTSFAQRLGATMSGGLAGAGAGMQFAASQATMGAMNRFAGPGGGMPGGMGGMMGGMGGPQYSSPAGPMNAQGPQGFGPFASGPQYSQGFPNSGFGNYQGPYGQSMYGGMSPSFFNTPVQGPGQPTFR